MFTDQTLTLTLTLTFFVSWGACSCEMAISDELPWGCNCNWQLFGFVLGVQHSVYKEHCAEKVDGCLDLICAYSRFIWKKSECGIISSPTIKLSHIAEVNFGALRALRRARSRIPDGRYPLSLGPVNPA